MKIIWALMWIALGLGAAGADPLSEQREQARRELSRSLPPAQLQRVEGMLNPQFDAAQDLELSDQERREWGVLLEGLTSRLQVGSATSLESLMLQGVRRAAPGLPWK